MPQIPGELTGTQTCNSAAVGTRLSENTETLSGVGSSFVAPL